MSTALEIGYGAFTTIAAKCRQAWRRRAVLAVGAAAFNVNRFEGNLLYAGTHVAFFRSYLYLAAVLRASFVVFIVSHRSSLLRVSWTLSNGTATYLSRVPRKPATFTMK